MNKITVAEALAELKNIYSEISSKIKSATFVSTGKTNETNEQIFAAINKTTKEISDNYNNIISLMKRRDSLKNAIVKSNAETFVEICGEKMTVAALIELKDSIKYKQELYRAIKDEYKSAKHGMEVANMSMEDKLENLINIAFGRDNNNKIKEEDYNSIAAPYRKANEFSLVDPLNIEKKLEELDAYLEDFSANADSVLQISNCTTEIETD